MENKENLTIEEMEVKLKKIEEDRAYYNECLKQKKTEAETKRKAELESVKEKRKNEIETKAKELNKLINKYVKDYGSLSIVSKDNDLLSSFYNHNFWF